MSSFSLFQFARFRKRLHTCTRRIAEQYSTLKIRQFCDRSIGSTAVSSTRAQISAPSMASGWLFVAFWWLCASAPKDTHWHNIDLYSYVDHVSFSNCTLTVEYCTYSYKYEYKLVLVQFMRIPHSVQYYSITEIGSPSLHNTTRECASTCGQLILFVQFTCTAFTGYLDILVQYRDMIVYTRNSSISCIVYTRTYTEFYNYTIIHARNY